MGSVRASGSSLENSDVQATSRCGIPPMTFDARTQQLANIPLFSGNTKTEPALGRVVFFFAIVDEYEVMRIAPTYLRASRRVSDKPLSLWDLCNA